MPVFTIILLAIIALFESLWASTLSSYYEAENPQNGRKFYLLGTNHHLPLSALSKPIVDHIKARYAVATEKNNPASASKPRQFSQARIEEYRKNQFIRTAQDQTDYLAKMNPLQKARFLAMIERIYPELAHDQNPEFKLSDLNSMGLQYLYSLCTSFYQGMDKQISAMFQSRHYAAAFRLDKGACMDSCYKYRENVRAEHAKNPSLQYEVFLRCVESDQPYSFDSIVRVEYAKQTCKERNILWMPMILEYNEKNGVDLFAFGKSHLYGKYGIVNLLLERGFKIKKANNLCEFRISPKNALKQIEEKTIAITKQAKEKAASTIKQAEEKAKKMVGDEVHRAKDQIYNLQQKFSNDKTKALALVGNINENFSKNLQSAQQTMKNSTVTVNRNFAKQFKAIQTKIKKSIKNKPRLILAEKQLVLKKQVKAKKLQAIERIFQKRKVLFIAKRDAELKLAKKKRDLMIQQATRTYKSKLEQAKKYNQTQKLKVQNTANITVKNAQEQSKKIIGHANIKVESLIK